MQRQRVAVDKAEATYEYMKKAHGQKLDKLTKTKQKMDKNKKDKQKENSRLRVHVEELERNVSLRSSIHRARAAGGDGTMSEAGEAGRKRMQSIVTRRKLIDLARGTCFFWVGGWGWLVVLDLVVLICVLFFFVVFSTATVTAQTDEIEFLRQELDRLRQRTFPSFASRRDHVGDAY